jgi:uncharacterized membrane-anchored protein YhcB (DUF1043 family)
MREQMMERYKKNYRHITKGRTRLNKKQQVVDGPTHDLTTDIAGGKVGQRISDGYDMLKDY